MRDVKSTARRVITCYTSHVYELSNWIFTKENLISACYVLLLQPASCAYRLTRQFFIKVVFRKCIMELANADK